MTKTVPNESFFSFFSPPKCGCLLVGVAMVKLWYTSAVEEEREEEEEVSQLLSDDYARAEFIRDRLVPKAVLFFTGEIMEDEDDVRWGLQWGCGWLTVCSLSSVWHGGGRGGGRR